eukprot:2394779-Pyramimonas_sp.AAC.1
MVVDQKPKRSARQSDDGARQASALPWLRPPIETHAPRGHGHGFPCIGVDNKGDVEAPKGRHERGRV